MDAPVAGVGTLLAEYFALNHVGHHAAGFSAFTTFRQALLTTFETAI